MVGFTGEAALGSPDDLYSSMGRHIEHRGTARRHPSYD